MFFSIIFYVLLLSIRCQDVDCVTNSGEIFIRIKESKRWKKKKNIRWDYSCFLDFQPGSKTENKGELQGTLEKWFSLRRVQCLGREPNKRNVMKRPATWKASKAMVLLLISETKIRKILREGYKSLPVKLWEICPFHPPLEELTFKRKEAECQDASFHFTAFKSQLKSSFHWWPRNRTLDAV